MRFQFAYFKLVIKNKVVYNLKTDDYQTFYFCIFVYRKYPNF